MDRGGVGGGRKSRENENGMVRNDYRKNTTIEINVRTMYRKWKQSEGKVRKTMGEE